ncbi:hypothetical protein COY27_02945 [Candidatus Woesearchaeota archaeon CG_4_10_14_0_2_um_filter_33_13]|nr:MAG: hypothetical protein COY27_02945 [Candidatus Woesearchaeota archaeon CG_4_10_14_0_2_um_filter_33_13]
MKSPQELYSALLQEELFKQWKQDHNDSFLSHFFSPLGSDFVLNSEFETGFYDSKDGKMTVFVYLTDGFVIKPADDVFKKEDAVVEELKLGDVKINFDQALEIFKEEFPQRFPSEQIGDGFVILQKYNGKNLWNFTFISKRLRFLNLKISAVDAKVEDQQEIDLVSK